MTTFERMCSDLDLLRESGKVLCPDAETPIEIDPEAKLTFAVWGDPQIASWSALRSARVEAACADLANCPQPLDALILAGDLTENGKPEEFQMLQKLLCDHHEGFRSLLCVSGNHDIRMRNYYRQRRLIAEFTESVPGGFAGNRKTYYHKVVLNGYTFLLMGSDLATFEAAHIGAKQLAWLDRELTVAEKDSVVFVVNHQTLKNTNGLPDTWLGKGDWRGTIGRQSDDVREIFEKHGNVFFITGHLHYGTCETTFEDHGAFKSLSVPTVGVVNHGSMDTPTQGYVIEVFADRIRLRARIFGEGRYLPSDLPGADVTVPFA